jgi:hypothetical protein
MRGDSCSYALPSPNAPEQYTDTDNSQPPVVRSVFEGCVVIDFVVSDSGGEVTGMHGGFEMRGGMPVTRHGL